MINTTAKNILFLGYDEKETVLIEDLRKIGCIVSHSQNKFSDATQYDLIISFGYRHIIKEEILSNLDVPIINLHISYLPWNKGSHPNFWSFYDCTPSGVTIHLIDSGIDTGPIIFQKYVNFDDNELTFKDTHKRLISEIEKLFISNIEDIVNGKYSLKPQRRKGTSHKKREIPKQFSGWDSNIEKEIIRLDKLLKKENFIVTKQKHISNNKTPQAFESRDGSLISLNWINKCPSKVILKLRNAEHVLLSIDQERISLEDHQEILSDYLEINRMDFIIKSETDGLFIGGVNLVKTSIGWEIGKYIGDKNFLGRGIAKKATRSMINFFADEFPQFTEIFAKTKITNNIDIKLNESLGFYKEKELPDNYILMKKIL